MGTKCLRSVQFSSGSDQPIDTPVVWEEQRKSYSSPTAEIPVHQLGVCRLVGGMACFAGCVCFLVRDAVWCQSDANLVQYRLTKVRSVQFGCLIGPTVSSFSSVRGTAAKSIRPVRSIQFTNSSGPGKTNFIFVYNTISWRSASHMPCVEGPGPPYLVFYDRVQIIVRWCAVRCGVGGYSGPGRNERHQAVPPRQ